jgi:large subunit ribosomal protein L5
MKRDLLYKTICPLSGNIHNLPKILNISLNMGSSLTDSQNQSPTGAKRKITQILSGLEMISCQKIKKTYAKKSIASFKLRKNQCIGGMVTLRNDTMFYFFEKFCSMILPKMREFQTLVLSQNKKDSFISSIDFSGGAFLLYPELSNQYEIFEGIKGFNVSLKIKKKERQKPIEKIVLSFFVP